MADLKGFTEQYGLNSRLVKAGRQAGRRGLQDRRPLRPADRRDRPAPRGGDSVCHRADGQRAAGADSVVSHRRGRRPREVRHRLGAGQGLAGGHDQRVHRGVSRCRGIKGAWEGARVLRQPREDRRASRSSPTTRSGSRTACRGIAKYRKPTVQGIVANAIDVVVETGDSGPVTPIGINLPNDQAIREKYGSKSVSLSNVNEAYDEVDARTGCAASSRGRRRKRSAREKFADVRRRAHDRHARGDRPRVGPAWRIGQGERRRTLLKEQFSALEEGRADLVGLYFIADPKLVELGIVPRGRSATTSCAPSTRPTPATPSCSCAASARARRSKKTTCATAR